MKKNVFQDEFGISNHILSILALPGILIGEVRYQRQGKGQEPEICEVTLSGGSVFLWFYAYS